MSRSYFPGKRYLTVWRLRLSAVLFTVFALSAFLFYENGILFIILTAVFSSLYVFLFAFYFPLRYKSISVTVTGNIIKYRRGMYYKSSSSVRVSSVRYCKRTSSPLKRAFSLCDVIIYSAGGTLKLPMLNVRDAEGLLLLIENTESRP